MGNGKRQGHHQQNLLNYRKVFLKVDEKMIEEENKRTKFQKPSEDKISVENHVQWCQRQVTGSEKKEMEYSSALG